MGSNRLIQSNVNHAPSAQDLLLQTMAERGVEIAVVAEPHRVPPDRSDWASDPTKKEVALTWRNTDTSLPCTFLEAGGSYVAARWGQWLVVGVYLPPRLKLPEVEGRLDDIQACVERYRQWPALVAGDFNAHSVKWGSRLTNAKGIAVENWAARLGLILLNRGSESTCVRPQGESVIDLTWAAPGVATKVTKWQLVTWVNPDSDHYYIQVDLGFTRQQVLKRRRPRPPRWSLRALDVDRLEGALRAGIWPAEEMQGDPEAGAERLGQLMARACDVAMPRVTPRERRAVYWWSSEIAELRRVANAARERLKHCRRHLRRGIGSRTEEAAAANVSADATYALRRQIGKAKAAAWQELLDSLDDNPWGRPYKLVMNKMKCWAPPFTESMNPPQRDRILAALFPTDGGEIAPWVEPPLESEGGWKEEWGVTEEELLGAVKRMRAKNRAPGPSGVPGRAWAAAGRVVAEHLRQLFDSCLRCGVFPSSWRRAKLVLLRKHGRPADSPSGYRPVCLLDEEAKLFERIIAGRLVQHLEEVGPDLHPHQYGFRRCRSTIDAVLRVREITETAVQEGRVAICVSLDISNAFNTLPWDRIGRALQHHGVPLYLRRVLRGYFQGRSLEFRGEDGALVTRGVYRGVPQGSVLGPHLWNLGYNSVLERAFLPPGCTAICYADDTLVIATGDDWGMAESRANDALASVVRRIEDLGLKVAPKKTEAMYFNGLRETPPPDTTIRVSDVPVPVGPTISYLGLTLDSQWCFKPYFERLAPRVERATGALSRLLPNIGGPGAHVRRLFTNVVHSLALYAAPVWAAEMRATPYIRTLMRRAHRRVAQRIVRAYRTTSYAAATALAGIPPLELQADMHARVYRRVRELREAHNNNVPPRAARLVKHQEQQRMVGLWSQWLADEADRANPRTRRAVAAIQPRLQDWIGRGGGGIPYRSAQILTGHGCFGEFLCWIGRERTKRCHHCGAPEDTAQHTLEECPEWDNERRDLVAAVGRDLSIHAIIDAWIRNERSRRAVVLFNETVMSRKEDHERTRRGEDALVRRGGAGRGRGNRRPRPRAHMRPI